MNDERHLLCACEAYCKGANTWALQRSCGWAKYAAALLLCRSAMSRATGLACHSAGPASQADGSAQVLPGERVPGVC